MEEEMTQNSRLKISEYFIKYLETIILEELFFLEMILSKFNYLIISVIHFNYYYYYFYYLDGFLFPLFHFIQFCIYNISPDVN